MNSKTFPQCGNIKICECEWINSINFSQFGQYLSFPFSKTTSALKHPSVPLSPSQALSSYSSQGPLCSFLQCPILIFQFYYQMSNKSQSTSLPPTKHFKICLEKRRPFLRSSPWPQLPHMQQITQNNPKRTSTERGRSTDVFLIVSTENSNQELCLPVGCLRMGESGRTALQGSLKDLQVMLWKQSLGEEEVAQVEHSLIEELLTLENQSTGPLCIPTKKIYLQQLNIIEAQSFQEEDQSLYDAQSQVVPLTEEEQHFFNNFILSELQQQQGEGQGKRSNEHLQGGIPQPTCLLQQRKKIIRNFFRPKASFFKDDKTRCNSSTNLQEINESSSNRMSFSPNKNDTPKHMGLARSGRFLTPFLE